MTLDQINELEKVIRITSMENTSFAQIAPADAYPTNEPEADRFIKSRIQGWLQNWVRGPIAILLEEDNEFQDI